MSTNTKFPLNVQIMNISSNLTRISEWASGDYQGKSSLIDRFLSQTHEYLVDLQKQNSSSELKETIADFTDQFNRLRAQRVTPENKLRWAEKALTWANILQHRAKLA
jgi:hypothetical protein